MSRRSTEGSRFSLSAQWNRALSIRSSNRSSAGTTNTNSTTSSHSHSLTSHPHRRGFSFTSLRGSSQPPLSKRLYRLIKSANNLVSAHETAARERLSIATQLSEWGEQTSSPSENNGGNDTAVSDISDKVGVLLSELGEQEEVYAGRLDESRGVLKVIRNTEKSVQPSRDGKRKIAEEIQRIKVKEPQSTRLVTLEQELVRAEAENLVAEAQLGNVTRQKLKEAYTVEFLATIERAEKQAILARHGLRLLQLLDDSAVVPGDVRPRYAHASQARQILNDAEDDLREWRLDAGFVGDDVRGADVGDDSTPVMGQRVEKGKGKENERLEKQGKEKEADRGSIADTEGDGLNARI